MNKLNLFKNEFKKSYYKSCGEYIIVLKKCIDTKCNENENRINIIDSENASYIANKMYIYDIIHKLDNTKSNNTSYQRFHIINCENYDNTNGIQYYKNFIRAFYDDIDILIDLYYTGYYIEYDNNGQKKQEGNYINGIKKGKWTIYNKLNINQHDISLCQLLQFIYYYFFNNNYYTLIY
jgi:hypothetical protein